MAKLISGIQQIGVGVKDLKTAWSWYIKAFGVDVRIFEDDTVAELMLPYTGGQPQQRHAALALNMQGGGGFEIWQYSKRTPLEPKFEIQLGDLGIFSAKIVCPDANKAFTHFKSIGAEVLGEVTTNPAGQKHLFVKDPFGNIFNVVENNQNWFNKPNEPTGATFGAVIGSSDIDKALPVYKEILGFDTILFDGTEIFADFASIPGGNRKFRRVILAHSQPRKGAFSKLLGNAQIELVQAIEGEEPRKIFQDRFWGDLGFIHLCFDISSMHDLEKECNEKGFPFTVNSNVKHNQDGSFDMGEAAGHFSYIEDPDGTLIEFVETHKVPILKKFGIYLNLKKRNPEKPLPRWMVNMLGIQKVKI
ncbi:MAG TPA: VOC family protein [Tenuifilaceae bacterium]|mgnify:CR=1 FL=1|nr:VOC family protein [Tenuifilaceae bacterium]